MTDRAEIIARIDVAIEMVTSVEGIPPTALLSLHGIDFLDIIDIRMAVEEEFGIEINEERDWTMNKIADLVIAAKEGR